MSQVDALQSVTLIECRAGCGACCIAPSISSPVPGMPHGKPAGVRCVQMDEQNRCRLFGQSERPAVCGQFNATLEVCGEDSGTALVNLQELEKLTA